ncbi:MAG: hypothetical protein ABIR91_01945 [Candidatus Saccharimonadales bacterium]
MTILLLIASAVVGAAAIYPYIRDIIRGIARPRIITWAIWTFLAGIMTLSALLAGEISSAVLSAQGFIGCGIVVILGWRQGSTTIGRLDATSLAGAVVGLIALVWLRDPTVALLLSVGIDAIAFAPTLKHAWTDPHEESTACYALNIAASGLAMIAGIGAGAGFIGLVYPIYSITFNMIMTTLLLAAGTSILNNKRRLDSEDAAT